MKWRGEVGVTFFDCGDYHHGGGGSLTMGKDFELTPRHYHFHLLRPSALNKSCSHFF
jgi:hypothetical protein